MDVDKAIKTRHSVRKFKTTKHVNWRDVIKAIDAARLAPLAGNLESIRFVLVTEEEKISELAQASMQPFIADAEYVVVICSDVKRQVRAYEERGKKYSSQQAGAAIENFLLKITDLGLASCWIGAFDDDKVKKILGIKDEAEVEAMFPVAYELGKGSQQYKPDLDRLLFFNKWGRKQMVPIRKPEPF